MWDRPCSRELRRDAQRGILKINKYSRWRLEKKAHICSSTARRKSGAPRARANFNMYSLFKKGSPVWLTTPVAIHWKKTLEACMNWYSVPICSWIGRRSIGRRVYSKLMDFFQDSSTKAYQEGTSKGISSSLHAVLASLQRREKETEVIGVSLVFLQWSEWSKVKRSESSAGEKTQETRSNIVKQLKWEIVVCRMIRTQKSFWDQHGIFWLTRELEVDFKLLDILKPVELLN